MSDKITHSRSWATAGFVAAAAFNIIGMLVVSKGLTNPLMAATDPVVYSLMGQIAVLLWGFAYLAVARSYLNVPFLLLVFCVEKLVYFTAWLMWLSTNGHMLPRIEAVSPTTAGFFMTYGAGDGLFAIFFGVMFIKALRARRAT